MNNEFCLSRPIFYRRQQPTANVRWQAIIYIADANQPNGVHPSLFKGLLGHISNGLEFPIAFSPARISSVETYVQGREKDRIPISLAYVQGRHQAPHRQALSTVVTGSKHRREEETADRLEAPSLEEETAVC